MFVIDFISVFPFDVMVVAGVFTASGGQTFDPSILRMIRMIRLLRLLKLARILRASRIFSRWENSISIKYSTRTLIFYLVVTLMTLHMLSCALGLCAQLQVCSLSVV